MNVLEKYRQQHGVTFQELADKAKTDVGNTYRHCKGTKHIGAEYTLRYHLALGIPLEDLRPDLYEQPAIPPPSAPEQAQAHDDTEQGGSPWTSAV